MYRQKLSSLIDQNHRGLVTNLHPSFVFPTYACTRIYGRWQEDRPYLSDVNCFQAYCWHFEDICYHLGGPHTRFTQTPMNGEVGRWDREGPARFITLRRCGIFSTIHGPIRHAESKREAAQESSGRATCEQTGCCIQYISVAIPNSGAHGDTITQVLWESTNIVFSDIIL